MGQRCFNKSFARYAILKRKHGVRSLSKQQAGKCSKMVSTRNLSYFFFLARMKPVCNALVAWCIVAVSSNVLRYNERRHISHNAIVVQNTSHCIEKVTQMWTENNGYSHSRDIVILSGSDLDKFYNGSNSDQSVDCLAVCVNMGTPEEFVHHPLPYLTFQQNGSSSKSDADMNTDSRYQLLDWNYNCRVAEVSVISFMPEALVLLWVDTPAGTFSVQTLPKLMLHLIFLPYVLTPTSPQPHSVQSEGTFPVARGLPRPHSRGHQ